MFISKFKKNGHYIDHYCLYISIYDEAHYEHYFKNVSGHPVAQFVKALRYKSEGRGFDSRWCHCNFSLT